MKRIVLLIISLFTIYGAYSQNDNDIEKTKEQVNQTSFV